MAIPGGDTDICPVCKRGQLIKRSEEITFSQRTNKGVVICHITIPVSVCAACKLTTWDEETEKILDEAVRGEYDKLP